MLLEPRFFFLKEVSPSIESILKSRLRFGIRTIKGYSNSHPLSLIWNLVLSVSLTPSNLCPILFSLYLTPVLYYLSFHISFLRQTRTFLFPRNCVSTSLFFSTWSSLPTHSYRSYRGCLIRVWRDLCVKSGGGGMCWLGGVYFFYQFYTP